MTYLSTVHMKRVPVNVLSEHCKRNSGPEEKQLHTHIHTLDE